MAGENITIYVADGPIPYLPYEKHCLPGKEGFPALGNKVAYVIENRLVDPRVPDMIKFSPMTGIEWNWHISRNNDPNTEYKFYKPTNDGKIPLVLKQQLPVEAYNVGDSIFAARLYDAKVHSKQHATMRVSSARIIKVTTMDGQEIRELVEQQKRQYEQNMQAVDLDMERVRKELNELRKRLRELETDKTRLLQDPENLDSILQLYD